MLMRRKSWKADRIAPSPTWCVRKSFRSPLTLSSLTRSSPGNLRRAGRSLTLNFRFKHAWRLAFRLPHGRGIAATRSRKGDLFAAQDHFALTDHLVVQPNAVFIGTVFGSD